jgi:hypothetical protein
MENLTESQSETDTSLSQSVIESETNLLVSDTESESEQLDNDHDEQLGTKSQVLDNDIIYPYEQQLIDNIYKLDLIQIIKTKKLSYNFVMNYVLNPDYQKDREEEEITLGKVLCNQPHLLKYFK